MEESYNESYILKPDHLTLSILYIERTLKGELVFDPKEVLRECSEWLDPEWLASSNGCQMGAAERGCCVGVDANG
jgi:hypothetical protein